MTGFNLPPGVSVRDLPGNRPEELAAEALYDEIYNQFPDDLTDEQKDLLAAWVYEQIGKAYADGYTQRQADEAFAAEATKAAKEITE